MIRVASDIEHPEFANFEFFNCQCEIRVGFLTCESTNVGK